MTTAPRRRFWRRAVPTAAALAAAAISLTACSAGAGSNGGSSAAPTSGGATSFTYLAINEDPTTSGNLQTLASGACKTENTALPYKVQKVPQASLDQKLQLLSGQNGLPAQYAAGNAPTLTQQLLKAGQLKDLTNTPVAADVLPAAASTIKSLYGGKLDVLPYGFNIEGFWYNKQLFAKQGLSVPTTFDELTADAAKFKSAGIQPFAAGSSGQGWMITRYISGYLFRELGPTAMSDIASGKAKLTDAKYVAAATAIANLGKEGYFGKAPGSVDYNGIFTQFLTGKAAMMYMGSWALSNFADKTADQIGASNIGFFSYPAVSGGSGSVDQYPANIGLPTGLNAKLYNSKVEAWASCIGKNYGALALQKGGISGFKTSATSSDALTKLVQDKIASSTQSVQWFEAFMSTKQTTAAWNNVTGLVTGSTSPSAYMQAVQAQQ